MKYRVYFFSKYRTRSADIFLFVFIFLLPFLAFSQVQVPFKQRASVYHPERYIYYIKGDFQLIGNTNLTPEFYTPTANNYNTMMKYVDIDDDPFTINSSSAELIFSNENGANPNCSDIMFAGLYWSGRSASDSTGLSSWVIGGTMETFPYNWEGTQLSCYFLTIESSGSNNNNINTYTFTPDGGGDIVIFRFYGGSTTGGGYLLTIQVGNNPAVRYNDVTFPTNSSPSSGETRTVTFNKPYQLSTGNCTIYINNLTKRTNPTPASDVSYVTIVTETETDYTLSSGSFGDGKSLEITGSGIMENNSTTYTVTTSGEIVEFNFYGANNPYITVTRNWQTDTLPALFSPGTISDTITVIKGTLLTPYEIFTGDFILEFSKKASPSDFTDTNFFNIKLQFITPPITINKNKVLFKHENDLQYQSIIASPQNIWYPTTTDHYIYTGYAEVTDYVKQYGLGDYFVANMALEEGDGGSVGFAGGWGLVVIYQNNLMEWRNISVFDGYTHIDSSTTEVEIDIEGFHTLQSGQVHLKLGVMATDGNMGISGDYMQLKNPTDTYIPLSHSGNTTNNFFNSSILTGGNNRNPNLVNNTGIDVAMFEINNTNNSLITNEQTDASFRFGTTGDIFSVYLLIMSVDGYIPTLDGVNVVSKINNIPIPEDSTYLVIYPGQELEYKLEVRNLGTEEIINTRIVIPLPYTGEYLSSTAQYEPGINGNYYFDPLEGSAGSIIWTLDTIPNGTINDIPATLYYRFKITEDCSILAGSNCNTTNEVTGYISGEGSGSNVGFDNISFIRGYETDGECIGSPIYGTLEVIIDADDFISENCEAVQDSLVRVFTYCNVSDVIPFTDVNGFFPIGTRFYNQYNPSLYDPVEGAVEYTMETGFPNLYGTYSYYADFPGEGCYAKFNIQVTTFESVPTVSESNLYYCQGDTAQPLMASPSSPTNNVYYYTQLYEGSASISLTPLTNQIGTRRYYAGEALTNGCVSTQRVPIDVTVNENPVVSLTASNPNNAICSGDSVTLSANTLAGKPFQFAWYNGNPISTPPIENATQSDYTTQIAGDYWVKVTDTLNNCETIAGPLTITSYTTPALSSSSLTLCGSGNDTISITTVGNIIGAISTINDSTAGSVILNNSDLIIQAANVTTDQYAVITYTDGNNCSASLQLQVKSRPRITLPTSYTVCQNSGDQIITATITNRSDDTLTLYNWNSTSFTTNSSYTAGTSQSGVQTITLQVRNEDGCASTLSSMTLTTRALPEILLSSESDGIIVNDSLYVCEENTAIFKSSVLGSSRTWRFPVNQIGISDSLIINDLFINNSGWVKVTVNQPGCIASDSIYMKIFPTQHEPGIILTIMNGSDTIRIIDHTTPVQIDTLVYTDSLWSSIYLPPTLYGCNYQIRIFSSRENRWQVWDTIPNDTVIIRTTEHITSGFNGIQIKYVPCGGYAFRCVEPIFFEYIGFIKPDSTVIYTPVPPDFVVCKNADSVRLTNIYTPGFNPTIQQYKYQYEYIYGSSGITYYLSSWASFAADSSDYITLIQGDDTLNYVLPSTPGVSIVEAPNQIETSAGDFVIISLMLVSTTTIITENDTIVTLDTSSISHEIWQITTPINIRYPIPNKTTCENDTTHWLNYNISSYVTDGLESINWVTIYWGTSWNDTFQRFGLIDTIPYFDYVINFHDHSYPRHISFRNFNTYDTLFFITEVIPTFSTCPSVFDSSFIAIRSQPEVPLVTSPQSTCDSLYLISVNSSPAEYKYEWTDQSAFLYEDSTYQNLNLARGDSALRYIRYSYINEPYCSGIPAEIEVFRYEDPDPGIITELVDTLCSGATIDPIASINDGIPAYGALHYRWLANNTPIAETEDSSYTPSAYYANTPGVYTFVRQVQDGCNRDWLSSTGVYELYIGSATTLVPRNATDKNLCYGNAMPEITYFDTLGNLSMGTEQLYWQGTMDSASPPTGITVNNLNHPTLPISISGTPQESGLFSYILYIPNAPVCGPDLTDTVNILVHAPLSGGVIEPEVQYTAANLPRLPIQDAISASGGSGTNSYQWQSSFDEILYQDISNSNNSSYIPTATTPANMTYRRVYSNECGIVYSNVATIYFSRVETTGQGVATSGRIASQNASFVNDKGKLVTYPFINQFGEKMVYNPYVITNGISDLTSSTAKFTGAVLFNGYSDIIEKGFEISTDSSFVTNPIRYNAITDLTYTYTFNVTDLVPETEYYIRAYAINNKGTGYGQTIRFVTK